MTRGCGRKDRIDGRSERDRKNENVATQRKKRHMMCAMFRISEHNIRKKAKGSKSQQAPQCINAKVLSNRSSLEVPTGSKSIVRILVKPTEFLCPTFILKRFSSPRLRLFLSLAVQSTAMDLCCVDDWCSWKALGKRANCRLIEGMRPKQNSVQTEHGFLSRVWQVSPGEDRRQRRAHLF